MTGSRRVVHRRRGAVRAGATFPRSRHGVAMLGVLAFLATGAARVAGQTTYPTADVARAAFDRLKSLEGEWEGPSMEAVTGAVVTENLRSEYRLTGAGSALMELASAGTPEEMLSIFFMDGERLVLQHYCSAGNQPRLELVRAEAGELVFDLAGGDNFDPAADGHIHEVRFTFSPAGPVESLWSWYEAGHEDHVARRILRHRRSGG